MKELRALEQAEEEADLLARALDFLKVQSNEGAYGASEQMKAYSATQEHLKTLSDEATPSSAASLLRALTTPLTNHKKGQSEQTLFEAPPSSSDNLSNSSAMYSLRNTLARLRAVMSRRLSATVEEASNKQAKYESALSREKEESKEKQWLERQLELERFEREKVWTQVCHEEERAVRELERVKADAEEARKATYEKARHEAETIESEHCERKQCLESEVERLKQELQSRRAQNHEREQQEKKRKERSETQLHEWKKQYNKHVGEKDRLISEIQSERDVVNKKLEELEVKHSQLREEANAHEAKMRELEEIRRQRELAAQRERCASFIQQFWRFKSNKDKKKKKKQQQQKSSSNKKLRNDTATARTAQRRTRSNRAAPISKKRA